MAVLGASGGGTKSNLPELIVITSRTFIPPYKCKVMVHCFGGGGGGGAAYINTESNTGIHGSGGGAGEHSCSLLTVDPAVTYTVTVGGGGSAGYVRNSQTTSNGNAGGASSFSGSDVVTTTANGGGAGTGSRFSNGPTTAGGAGGTNGAGNLFKLTGGAGGSCVKGNSSSSSCNAHELATGGGAVNIYGNAFNGGWSVYNGANPSAKFIAGGAGIGGYAGTASSGNGWELSTVGGNLYGNSGSGGNNRHGYAPPSFKDGHNFGFGDQISDTSSIPDMGNKTKGSIFTLIQHLVLNNATGVQPPGIGGRGCGVGPDTGGGAQQNVRSPASNASLFAGGGALRSYSDGVNVSNGYGGSGGAGGGGGGGNVYRGQGTTTQWSYAGGGGKGLVVIQFIEVVS